MKFRVVIMWVVLLGSLVLLYGMHRGLNKLLRPRESLWRLAVYVLSAFGFVFLYSFLIVWLISYIFPVSMK